MPSASKQFITIWSFSNMCMINHESRVHNIDEQRQHLLHVWQRLQQSLTGDVLPPFYDRQSIYCSWSDHVSNEDLMGRSGMQALSQMVKLRRMTLAGHVMRQSEIRPALIAMNWLPED